MEENVKFIIYYFQLFKNMYKSSIFRVSLIISSWNSVKKYIASRILDVNSNVCSWGVQQKTKCMFFFNSRMFKKSKKMRKEKFIFIIRKLFSSIISINFSWPRLVVGQCYWLVHFPKTTCKVLSSKFFNSSDLFHENGNKIH